MYGGDFVLNGQAYGDAASMLMEHDFNPKALRPFRGRDGQPLVEVPVRNHYGMPVMNADGSMQTRVQVTNAPATLRKDEWQEIDRVVVQAARERLRVTQDLIGAGLTYNIPDGMSKTVLQTQSMSDITGAHVAMDPITPADRDRPQFELYNLPLPVTFKGFSYSAREIAAGRNMGNPIDTTQAAMAAQRVAEEIEKMVLGVSSAGQTYAYGGGTIYGYLDHPNRVTGNITAPTAGGWTGATLINEVLGGIKSLKEKHQYGPYMVYHGMNWDEYMDADYSDQKGDNTLRDRLERNPDITAVRSVDFLPTTGFDLLVVQMSPQTIRLVNGMAITTVQWETHGGFGREFKVVAIMVPQVRKDYNDNCGILHLSVA